MRSNMGRILRLTLRALLIFWTLLLTALIGNAIANDLNAPGLSKAAVNFAMFVAILSWIASLYGLAWELFPALFRAVVTLPLEAMCALFAFIAAVVLSAKLGVVNCAAIVPKEKPGDYIAFGSANLEKRCREIQGGAVFLWFLFACYAVQLWLSIKEARQVGGLNVRVGGASILSSRPAMSQLSSSLV
jgi:hypothetical protein